MSREQNQGTSPSKLDHEITTSHSEFFSRLLNLSISEAPKNIDGLFDGVWQAPSPAKRALGLGLVLTVDDLYWTI